MATGGIGVVTTTGTTTPGIEIIPSIIGGVETFIGHHQLMVVEMFTERLLSTERPKFTERPTHRTSREVSTTRGDNFR
jgi:hypothetical protein